MKFVFLDEDVTISCASCLDPLYQWGEVKIYDTIPQNDKEVVLRSRDAEVVIFSTTRLSQWVLDRMQKVKILQYLGTGVWNMLDVGYAESKGIEVLNVENYGNNAVAEFTLGLAFNLSRHITRAACRMKKEVWHLGEQEGVEIEGSTFGVVGTGNIGEVVAKKASLLGAKVLAHDLVEKKELVEEYGVTYVSLLEVFSQANFLSLHLKTTPQTMGLIDEALLKKMKPDAFLINVARSQIMDYEALYRLLSQGKIMGAALDVFPEEPPADYRFSHLENVITTPHMGYYTKGAVRKMLTGAIENILSALERMRPMN